VKLFTVYLLLKLDGKLQSLLTIHYITLKYNTYIAYNTKEKVKFVALFSCEISFRVRIQELYSFNLSCRLFGVPSLCWWISSMRPDIRLLNNEYAKTHMPVTRLHCVIGIKHRIVYKYIMLAFVPRQFLRLKRISVSRQSLRANPASLPPRLMQRRVGKY